MLQLWTEEQMALRHLWGALSSGLLFTGSKTVVKAGYDRTTCTI